jgi:hypothetical protein
MQIENIDLGWNGSLMEVNHLFPATGCLLQVQSIKKDLSFPLKQLTTSIINLYMVMIKMTLLLATVS